MPTMIGPGSTSLGRRVCIAGIAVLVSTILFVGLSAGPAIAWLIRFGVWIQG
jgi:hypothetical protein